MPAWPLKHGLTAVLAETRAGRESVQVRGASWSGAVTAEPSAGSRFWVATFCGLNGPSAREDSLDEVSVCRRALARLRAGEVDPAAAALR